MGIIKSGAKLSLLDNGESPAELANRLLATPRRKAAEYIKANRQKITDDAVALHAERDNKARHEALIAHANELGTSISGLSMVLGIPSSNMDAWRHKFGLTQVRRRYPMTPTELQELWGPKAVYPIKPYQPKKRFSTKARTARTRAPRTSPAPAKTTAVAHAQAPISVSVATSGGATITMKISSSADVQMLVRLLDALI